MLPPEYLHCWVPSKNVSPFDPAVWPAIGNMYTHYACLVLFIIIKWLAESRMNWLFLGIEGNAAGVEAGDIEDTRDQDQGREGDHSDHADTDQSDHNDRLDHQEKKKQIVTKLLSFFLTTRNLNYGRKIVRVWIFKYFLFLSEFFVI